MPLSAKGLLYSGGKGGLNRGLFTKSGGSGMKERDGEKVVVLAAGEGTGVVVVVDEVLVKFVFGAEVLPCATLLKTAARSCSKELPPRPKAPPGRAPPFGLSRLADPTPRVISSQIHLSIVLMIFTFLEQ